MGTHSTNDVARTETKLHSPLMAKDVLGAGSCKSFNGNTAAKVKTGLHAKMPLEGVDQVAIREGMHNSAFQQGDPRRQAEYQNPKVTAVDLYKLDVACGLLLT